MEVAIRAENAKRCVAGQIKRGPAPAFKNYLLGKCQEINVKKKTFGLIFCYLKHRKLVVVNFVLISLLNHGNTVEREDDGRVDEVGEEDEEDEDDGGVLSQSGTAGEDEESVARY